MAPLHNVHFYTQDGVMVQSAFVCNIWYWVTGCVCVYSTVQQVFFTSETKLKSVYTSNYLQRHQED